MPFHIEDEPSTVNVFAVEFGAHPEMFLDVSPGPWGYWGAEQLHITSEASTSNTQKLICQAPVSWMPPFSYPVLVICILSVASPVRLANFRLLS